MIKVILRKKHGEKYASNSEKVNTFVDHNQSK